MYAMLSFTFFVFSQKNTYEKKKLFLREIAIPKNAKKKPKKHTLNMFLIDPNDTLRGKKIAMHVNPRRTIYYPNQYICPAFKAKLQLNSKWCIENFDFKFKHAAINTTL